jgi:hypothetical protein
MKRFILGLVMLVGIIATTGVASAAKLVTREVGWVTNLATSASNPNYTARKGFNGSFADTTMPFSLTNVSIPSTALAGTANKDTVTVAYVRFFTDTTVAVTNTASTLSYVIEASGDGYTWAAVVTNASNAIVASGDQYFAIPLWANLGTGNNATGTKTSPLLTAPYLRIRFTGGTGNFFAARCQLVHWAD